MPRLGRVLKGDAVISTGTGGTDANKVLQADQELMARLLEKMQADYQAQQAQEVKADLQAMLQNEKSLVAVNRAKIERGWMRVRRLAKVAELRADVEVLAADYGRDLDRLTAMLSALDAEAEDADAARGAAVGAHSAALERLMELQTARVDDLSRAFATAMAEVVAAGEARRDALEQMHNQALRDVVALVNSVREVEERKAADARHSFETAREELKNTAIERLQELSRRLDDEINDLEAEFEAAHLAYLQATDSRTREFQKLTVCDQKATRDAEKRAKSIARLQTAVTGWRAKLAANVRESTARNAALQAQRDALLVSVRRLKKRMENARLVAQDRLRGVCISAQAEKDEVGNRLRIAERIVTLFERARGMQTEQELVAPAAAVDGSAVAAPATDGPHMKLKPGSTAAMGASGRGTQAGRSARLREFRQAASTITRSLTTAEGGQRAGAAAATGADAGALGSEQQLSASHADMAAEHMAAFREAGLPMDDVRILDNFWAQYNSALMDKLALEQRRQELREENAALQSLAQQYLDGLTVAPDAMDRPNTLLVTNGVTNAVMPARRVAAKVPGVALEESIRAATAQGARAPVRR